MRQGVVPEAFETLFRPYYDQTATDNRQFFVDIPQRRMVKHKKKDVKNLQAAGSCHLFQHTQMQERWHAIEIDQMVASLDQPRSRNHIVKYGRIF